MLSRTDHLRPNCLHQGQLLRVLERGNVEEGRRWIENDRTNVNHVYIKKKVRIQSSSELTITDEHEAYRLQ